MSEELAPRMTPTRAIRAMFAPYRRRDEKAMAANQKRDARIRRVLDAHDAEMRAIYGADSTSSTQSASAQSA
jgi:hypothetical protein